MKLKKHVLLGSLLAACGLFSSAASAQIYGSEKGTWEKATEAAADAASSVSKQASEAVYGTQTGYVEAAQSSLAAAASSAPRSRRSGTR